jgi:hypothetical protein
MQDGTKAEMVGLVKEYRSGSIVSDVLIEKLHETMLKVSGTENKAKPAFENKEEKDRYIAHSVGYLYGAMEAVAYAALIDENRPYIDSRHKETFGKMVVEAELMLGTPNNGTLSSLVAGLKAMPQQPKAGMINILVKVQQIDARIAAGATIVEVYPSVLGVINELTGLIDKEGPQAMPMAIAELLRVIDLYADRNDRTFVDRLRRKATELLPIAVRSIQGAA